MKNINPNNLKIGDTIFVEQAWEDQAGNFHDEHGTVCCIGGDGLLSLGFKNQIVNEFLSRAEFFAKDYKKL